MSRRFQLAVLTTVFALGALASSAEAADHDPYAGRNGRAEALRDIRRGKPLKLYTHIFNAEGPGTRTPGLKFCSPDENIGTKAAQRMFVFVPEAAQGEAEQITIEEMKHVESSEAFSKAYNTTVFLKRAGQIRKFCPKAMLDNR